MKNHLEVVKVVLLCLIAFELMILINKIKRPMTKELYDIEILKMVNDEISSQEFNRRIDSRIPVVCVPDSVYVEGEVGLKGGAIEVEGTVNVGNTVDIVGSVDVDNLVRVMVER